MAIQENPYLPPTARVADAVEVEGDFIDGGRAVEAGRGSSWIGAGWRTFRADPGTWILIAIVLVAISLAVSIVPFIGSFAIQLLMPVFVGGLMIACRRRQNGEAVGVSDLFAAFQTHVGPLVIVGAVGLGLYILAMIPGALILVWAGFGGSGFGMRAVLGLLVLFALIVPVQMALWFASPLVVFHGLRPTAALGQSFRACLRNILPFLIYGAIVFLLAILATLPLLLGWLALGPVLIGSVYAAYKDIFFNG
ncbi:MAG TPA: BPSS1780 family membrane protein [Burkholderiales bacterium]|nr:BPSS1780 family membrane protein [Burkholderiales bacterium]